jgi:two-component system, cell cycle sensor histidine kinase and response regulator CckA
MANPPLKILLVEDNPGDVLLLQETLAEITHFSVELIYVERLAQALHHLKSGPFDVVLLDLLLPDSEGLETFLQIYDQIPLIPIVVLTGIADETLALHAMQAGAQDYLVKGKASSSSDLLMRSIRYAIERKRNETTLYQREQEFRTLTENAPDIIARFDRDLRHLYVNPAIEPVTGLLVQDFLGKTNRDLGMPEDWVAQWETVLRQVFQTGEQTPFQFEFLTPSGIQHFQARCVPEFALDRSVSSVLSITRNITEQKHLESQLLRAQRLESLGTLASGIAHDLNNILTPIMATAQLLPLTLPPLDEQNQHLLTLLNDSASRGASLVQQILFFAKGTAGNRITLQITHLLRELRQLVNQTFPKSIDVQIYIPEGLWMIVGDATQLHQVLMNLCINARDAMPNGGVLSLFPENLWIDEQYAQLELEAQVGPYLVITVSDTGTGIAPDILDRIFDPFFSTKEMGKGTGLGLSTVLGIVKSYGGFVKVSSEVGKGTQFKVFFPATEATDSVVPENLCFPEGNGELILVVDDEPSILSICKETLQLHNYRVLTATDGIDAIAQYAQHKIEVSVVLMDMMMPELGGEGAIKTLKRLNPQVKIIATSGITANQGLAEAAGAEASFLSKPFSANDLLNILHGVLTKDSSI